MTYPIAVIGISLSITTSSYRKSRSGLFKDFLRFHSKLPAPTQFLIDLSDFIGRVLAFIIIIIVGIFLGIRHILRTKQRLRAMGSV